MHIHTAPLRCPAMTLCSAIVISSSALPVDVSISASASGHESACERGKRREKRGKKQEEESRVVIAFSLIIRIIEFVMQIHSSVLTVGMPISASTSGHESAVYA